MRLASLILVSILLAFASMAQEVSNETVADEKPKKKKRKPPKKEMNNYNV